MINDPQKEGRREKGEEGRKEEGKKERGKEGRKEGGKEEKRQTPSTELKGNRVSPLFFSCHGIQGMIRTFFFTILSKYINILQYSKFP